jgi:hypothetical protein
MEAHREIIRLYQEILSMSKKLYSSQKWKAYLKRRQQAELAKRQSRNRISRGPTRARVVPHQHQKRFLQLHVPTNFSLIQNPNEVVTFLNQVKALAKKSNLMLDLTRVTEMSTEAIAALIAVMTNVRDYAHVRGNHPENPEMRELLSQSGFFSHVASTEPIVKATKGKFLEKRSKKVDPYLARELVRSGTTALYGAPQKRKPAYRTLIEGMNNTHNHAAKDDRGATTWWSMVYADTRRKRICYAFVDTGVGIFRSVRLSNLRQVYRRLKLVSNAKILQEILEGKVQSSTGVAYRGKGLPAVYRDCKEQRIKNVVILANDVYADVSRSDYRILESQFGGTLLYWETD